MITRRCTQRQYLLRPDEELNQIYLYVLGLAAQRSGVEVIHATAMSNHGHDVVHDPEGTRVGFYQYLHSLVARATNRLRKRRENLWSSEQTSVVRLVELDDIVEKVVYAATNPVRAGLVARVHHWPGVNTLKALLDKEPLVIERPLGFFSKKMPATVTLRLAIPPELGDEDELLARIRRRVAEVEKELEARRLAEGRRVLGRRAVRKQSWRARPSTDEVRGGLRPTVAARNPRARVEALARCRAFLEAYRGARERWLAGLPTLFPYGTYYLLRFAFVPVEGPPKVPIPAA